MSVEDVVLNDNIENTSGDIDEEEMLEISANDWQAILDSINALEDDVDIEDKIERTLFENRNIYLQGVIDEDTVSQVVPMIHYYGVSDDENGIEPSERQPIKLYLNSEGGELYNGRAVLAAIENSKTPVWTYCEGSIGMSMGLLLFLSGHKRFMSRHSTLMYHQLAAGSNPSTLSEMQNILRHYEQTQDYIDEYVVEKTKMPIEQLRYYRERNLDYFIDFKEAKKYEMFDVEI